MDNFLVRDVRASPPPWQPRGPGNPTQRRSDEDALHRVHTPTFRTLSWSGQELVFVKLDKSVRESQDTL